MKIPIIPIPSASEETVKALMDMGILVVKEDGIHVNENIPTTDRKSE